MKSFNRGVEKILKLNNLPVVNHINNVRSNNRVENLEWVTYSENQKHAIRIGARKIPRNFEDYLQNSAQQILSGIKSRGKGTGIEVSLLMPLNGAGVIGDNRLEGNE